MTIKNEKQKPTIVDIAINLGISPASVSRAIRNAGKVGPDLREKILRESERLGYKPNYAARSLRNKSSQLIGVIIPDFFSFQVDALVTQIQTHAQQNQCGIILGISQWDSKTEIEQLNFMVSKRVDGIIIKSRGSREVIEKIHELSMDGVKIISLLDKIDIPNVSSVLVDNVLGGYLATKHLLEHGHERILYATYKQTLLNEGNDSHFSRERYFGMLQAYAEMKVKRPENLVFYDESSNQDNDTEQWFIEFFKSKRDYSAIFAYDDKIAAGISRAMRSLGRKVPDDFSLVGFDDSILVSRWSYPPITVIRQPDQKIACEAVNLIVNGNSDDGPQDAVVIRPELIQRKSVKTFVSAPASVTL